MRHWPWCAATSTCSRLPTGRRPSPSAVRRWLARGRRCSGSGVPRGLRWRRSQAGPLEGRWRSGSRTRPKVRTSTRRRQSFCTPGRAFWAMPGVVGGLRSTCGGMDHRGRITRSRLSQLSQDRRRVLPKCLSAPRHHQRWANTRTCFRAAPCADLTSVPVKSCCGHLLWSLARQCSPHRSALPLFRRALRLRVCCISAGVCGRCCGGSWAVALRSAGGMGAAAARQVGAGHIRPLRRRVRVQLQGSAVS